MCDVRLNRPLEGRGKSVFRPVAGDECAVVVWTVRHSGPCRSSWLRPATNDSTDENDATEMRVRLGEADCAVDRGFEAVLADMRPGERREFSVGDCGDEATVVSGRVELLAVRRRCCRRIADQDRLAEAERHKSAGCALFAEGRYADAFHRFRECARAVLFLRDPAAVREARDPLYAAVCNNMAACQLRFGNHEHALRLCDKTLSVDPDNVKALVRRCRAAAELRMFDAALADGRRAAALQPGNAVVRRCLAVAESGVRAQDVRYEHMVRKMFAG